MRWCRVIILAAVMLAWSRVWGQAVQRQMGVLPLDTRAREVAGLPSLGKRNLDQIVRFRLEGDQLSVQPLMEPVATMSRVEIPQLPGLTQVAMRVARRPAGGAQPLFFQMQHRDPNPPDGILSELTLYVLPQNLNIRRVLQKDDHSLVVQLIQSGLTGSADRTRLMVQRIRTADGVLLEDKSYAAANLGELRRRYPQVSVDYLRPLFAAMKQERVVFAVDAHAGWQVLAEYWPADAKAAEQVRAMLRQMDNESYATREGASRELAKMGQPAAMVLMQMDRGALSPEQTLRVDGFLAAYLPLNAKQVKRLGQDPDFLVDCLASDDTALAAAALKQLQTVLGQEVAFDLKRPVDERFAALPALRRALASPPATTAPVRTTDQHR